MFRVGVRHGFRGADRFNRLTWRAVKRALCRCAAGAPGRGTYLLCMESLMEGFGGDWPLVLLPVQDVFGASPVEQVLLMPVCLDR